MSDNKKDKLEQFDLDKKEEELNDKKVKKKLYKRIRNIILVIGVIAALLIIYQK